MTAYVPVAGDEAGVKVATAMTRPDFAEFYREQWSDVAGYSASVSGSRSAGDEIAQEAFTRLYARWPLIREPRPYVFRIATHLAYRHRRRQGREVLVDDLPTAEPSAELDPQLAGIIAGLPDRLRAVILLHYYADLPGARGRRRAAASGRVGQTPTARSSPTHRCLPEVPRCVN